MNPERGTGGLPGGYRCEPTSLDRLGDISRLVNIVAIDEAGRTDISEDLLRSMLTEPGHDFACDTATIVAADGSIVGFEWLRCAAPYTDGVSWGGVHPDHVGRGIGTALVAWAADRILEHEPEVARDEAMVHRVWTHADHERSQELLTGCGYASATFFLEMVVEFTGPPRAADTVAGIAIEGFRPDTDIASYATAHEDAFADHFGHVVVSPSLAEERIRHLCSEEQFDAGLWWMAWDGDEVAGYLQGWPSDDADERLGHVANLGVRSPWRGRGLGRALLLTAFAEFHRRGIAGVSLQVDAGNRTPALGLYESVGMHRQSSRHVLQKTLRRPGG